MRPFKTVADGIAGAKAQPGRISVATPGNGSVNQIVLEWMALNTGTKFQHIPYKGGAPAAACARRRRHPARDPRELVGRPARQVRPRARAGGDRRQAVEASIPDWPTLQEDGVKEVDASNWTALYAPKGTPQPIIDKLNAEVVEDPQHAGRQGALRRRRRRDHPVERGGA